MNRKLESLGIFASITALALLSGCAPEKQKQIIKIMPVGVYVAKEDSISSYITLTGGIEAQNDAFVYSKISERLISLNVKPGDRVSAGQVIGSQYNESARHGIKVSEASLKSATIQFESAKIDFERMKNLLEKNAITKQQYDQAKSQFDITQASIDQVSASLEQVNVQYNNAILTAPFDGQVAMIYYDINDMISAGQPVIKIVDAKTVKAKLNIPEIDINKISIGQTIKATFPSIAESVFSGTVYRIDGAVNPSSRTLEVEVRINNKDNVLKSGISGEFKIETQNHQKTIVVSDMTIMTRTSIITDERGFQTEQYDNYIYLNKNRKAFKTSVKTGLSSNGLIEIVKGITFGDSIIVTGQNMVKDGDTTRIVTNLEL